MDKQRQQNIEIWGGIECTINRVGNEYFDQLDYSGHYSRPSDIDHIAALGIRKLRYPVLWERHQPRMDTVPDWTFAANNLDRLRESGIEPIAGLVHHGSGPAYASFLNGTFETGLARYAAAVAERFPWITDYTPVNEPLTTARFCGLYGHWYPHKKGNKFFTRILISECKATVMAMEAIRQINPEARLIQTDDLGKTYSTPRLRYQADFENERRWLAFDLISGRVNPSHPMWGYLMYSGIPEEDLHYFLEHHIEPAIIGLNYYLTSERYIDEDRNHYPRHTHGSNGRHRYADVEAVRVCLKEPTGPKELIREAWERYHLPLALTEVHLHCTREDQLRWFYEMWRTGCQLKEEGVDIRAITAWALLGSHGWNRLLTRPNGDYESGVFNISGNKLQHTGLAHLIRGIIDGKERHHPILDAAGWWHRDHRILYRREALKLPGRKGADAPSPLVILCRNGPIGQAFANICGDRGIHCLITRYTELIADTDRIRDMIREERPWGIIHATGFTGADHTADDFDSCYQSNCEGPALLADYCRQHNVRLVTFSSYLVFDGLKGSPYTESDSPSPLSLFGKSKAMAEQRVLEHNLAALVIRTGPAFGPGSQDHFLAGLIRALKGGRPVMLADNVYVSPTYIPDLVHKTLDLLLDEATGIYHVANNGQVSWAELARMAAHRTGLDPTLVEPSAGSRVPGRAQRPLCSVLHSEKGVQLPSLDHALDRYFAEWTPEATSQAELIA